MLDPREYVAPAKGMNGNKSKITPPSQLVNAFFERFGRPPPMHHSNVQLTCIELLIDSKNPILTLSNKYFTGLRNGCALIHAIALSSWRTTGTNTLGLKLVLPHQDTCTKPFFYKDKVTLVTKSFPCSAIDTVADNFFVYDVEEENSSIARELPDVTIDGILHSAEKALGEWAVPLDSDMGEALQHLYKCYPNLVPAKKGEAAGKACYWLSANPDDPTGYPAWINELKNIFTERIVPFNNIKLEVVDLLRDPQAQTPVEPWSLWMELYFCTSPPN